MTYEEAVRKEEDLVKPYTIANNIITNFDINVVGHFGNVVCLEVMCHNCIPYGHANNTKNVGYVLKALYELFNLSTDNGTRLSDIRNIPYRLVFKGTSCLDPIVGIGNFMKDEFILFDDLSLINGTTRKEEK